jgi:hypothetical protein
MAGPREGCVRCGEPISYLSKCTPSPGVLVRFGIDEVANLGPAAPMIGSHNRSFYAQARFLECPGTQTLLLSLPFPLDRRYASRIEAGQLSRIED